MPTAKTDNIRLAQVSAADQNRRKPMVPVPDVSILVVTAVVVVLTYYTLRTVRKLPAWKKGKKQYAPIAGTLFHQLMHFRRYNDYLTDLTRRHKTFRLLGPAHSEIFTADPANVEYILRDNFINYGKGWMWADVTSEIFGDGIFIVDGEKWRHQRKLASFEFSTKVLRDFSSVVFKNNAVKLAHVVSEAARTNKIIDMQDLFMKSTMDSMFQVTFGMELNCHSGENIEGVRFTKAVDDSSEHLMWRLVNPLWPVARFLNIGSEAAFKENIQLIDDFIYKLISTKTSDKSSDINGNVKREDMLSRFLLQRENDPVKMNDKYLRDIILSFVVAGKDTTAITLSWFLYVLCKHPSVLQKLVLEIEDAIKSNNSTTFDEFATCITEEAINKMQYLHATLSETLRLYPAIPTDSKVCFSDDELPDGFSVRKDDVVTYQPYPMGRMQFIWGEDAEIFRPERWLDENGIFQPESPFKFPAFQAGPRICLGKEFAYRQMKIFAAVLLHFFKFKLKDENKVVTYRTTLTLHIDKGLPLHVFHR